MNSIEVLSNPCDAVAAAAALNSDDYLKPPSWHTIWPPGVTVTPRSTAAFVPINKREIVILGGASPEFTTSVILFDTVNESLDKVYEEEKSQFRV